MDHFKISTNKPVKFKVKKGEHYSFCTCGLSGKMPLCDGAHKEQAPGYKSLKFEADKDGDIWLCDGLKADDPRLIKKKKTPTDDVEAA